MLTTLSILNGSGDTKVTWNHDNPDEVAQARKTVADLAAAGYTFFLTDGTPADAVTAGGGTLIARKLAPEEVVDATADTPPGDAEPTDTPDAATVPKRRGRPPKVRPAGTETNVVAVRPLRGG